MQALWLEPMSYKMPRSSPDLRSLLSRNLLLRLNLESDRCVLAGSPSFLWRAKKLAQNMFPQNALHAAKLRVQSDDGLLTLQQGRRFAP